MAKLYYTQIIIIIVFTCILTTFSLFHPTRARVVHNVLHFGANPNGVEDMNTTKAFLKSWEAACNTSGPVTIEVPEGRYMLRPLEFDGSVCASKDITLNISGSLVAPKDYNMLCKAKNWLTFKKVSGVSIVGGDLDANGSFFWICKTSYKGQCPNCQGATSLRFFDSKDSRIIGLKSFNSQMFHIAINGCQNIHIEDVHVIAPASSPNTDGIHVESTTDITIINSTMQTGDDCISIGPGVRNLHIESIFCGPGHGISIGSLGRGGSDEAGVDNVTVKSVTINNTDNGLRIKTWARPISIGFVKRVLYQNVTLQNVTNPIIVDQHYCPHNNCTSQESRVNISNVTYSGIYGTSAAKEAIKFDCSRLNPCSDILLEDINISYLDEDKIEDAQSICNNVKGEVLGVVIPKSCF